MIKMKVMGIAIDTRTGSPIVILKDEEDRRALPIWIGSAEASAIIRTIEGIPVSRPMTHDLICQIIKDTGYKVEKIEICDVEEETYYANIYLKNEESELIIDSRPSDAIALAIRCDADIFVTTKVVMESAISTNKEKDEEEAQNFKEFIKDLKPSDFQQFLNENQE